MRNFTSMKFVIDMLIRFWKNDEGLEMIEYAVLTALIVVALVVSITALVFAMSGRFEGTATWLNS